MPKELVIETKTTLLNNPVVDSAGSPVKIITETDTETKETTTYETDTRTTLLNNPVLDDAGSPIIDIKPTN